MTSASSSLLGDLAYLFGHIGLLNLVLLIFILLFQMKEGVNN